MKLIEQNRNMWIITPPAPPELSTCVRHWFKNIFPCQLLKTPVKTLAKDLIRKVSVFEKCLYLTDGCTEEVSLLEGCMSVLGLTTLIQEKL